MGGNNSRGKPTNGGDGLTAEASKMETAQDTAGEEVAAADGVVAEVVEGAMDTAQEIAEEAKSKAAEMVEDSKEKKELPSVEDLKAEAKNIAKDAVAKGIDKAKEVAEDELQHVASDVKQALPTAEEVKPEEGEESGGAEQDAPSKDDDVTAEKIEVESNKPTSEDIAEDQEVVAED